ncbi:hypothetical protein IE993_11115 [Klebsiella pneumoniae]|nr:hypothetical protein [Klebsiella pneumoniae]
MATSPRRIGAPFCRGDNQAAIIFCRLHLIVGGEGHRPRRAVKAPFRRVDVGAGYRGAHCFAGQPERGDGLGR